MEIPKPGAAHTRLHALAGLWSGEERLHPAPWDPAGGMANAVVRNRVVLDGFAVVQEYEQYRDGNRTFSGHGLFWWDGAANQYVMTWFDSMMGVPAEFRGGFEGDVLRLMNTMPQGGVVRCSFDCGVRGEYVFTMEVSQDGQAWSPSMEGAYSVVTEPVRRSPTTRPAARTARKASAKKVARKTVAGKPAVKKGAARRRTARPAPPKKTASKRRGPARAAKRSTRTKK